MKRQKNRIFVLFLNMLYISACTFGGGFVIVSIMKKKFVDELKWMTEEEMLDIIAISQSCPGAIAVNAAIMTGRNLCGAAGVVFAVLGTIIPPVAIIMLISLFYNAFAANRIVTAVLFAMQAGVAAVVIDVAISLLIKELKKKQIFSNALMAVAFVLVFFFKINVILVILGGALAGAVFALATRKGGKNDLS